MIGIHEPITQSDMDDLATLANLTSVIPLNYLKTATELSPPDDTISGSFSFVDHAAAENYAWRDELDRIWYSVWNYNFGETVADDITSGSLSQGVTINMNQLWTVLSEWWIGGGAPDDRRTVVSTGPNLWTWYSHNDFTNTESPPRFQVEAFRNAQFIFSQLDQPAFNLLPGFILGTIDEPLVVAGDNAEHDLSDPALVEIDLVVPGALVFGMFKFEFECDPGTPDPDTGSCGFYDYGSVGVVNAGTRVGNIITIWYGSSTTPELILDNSGSGLFVGTMKFYGWLGAGASDGQGWRFKRFTYIGLLQTLDPIPSSDATVTDYKVIHPRNEAMRAVAHVNTDVYLTSGDILDFDGLMASFNAGTYPPSIYILSQFTGDLPTWISEYPGGLNDGSILAELVIQLNDEIIDNTGSIASGGAWDDVDLREITQWLLGVDPPDGSRLLQQLNRLLLEDAYPSYINRLVPPAVSPEDEIVQLDLPDVVDGDTYSVGNGDFTPGYFCDVQGITGIYVAKAWPQAFFHSFLDFDLPQYRWSTPAGLRAPVPFPSTATVASVPSAAKNLTSTWPVMSASDFGSRIGDVKGLAGMSAYTPYFNTTAQPWDRHHIWIDSGQYTLAEDEQAHFSYFLPATSATEIDKDMRVEFSCGNRLVTIYVGVDATSPDPDDAGTYLFSRTGSFVFPDDYADESLLPNDYKGRYIQITLRNETADTQETDCVWSRFYPRGDEEVDEIPRPEPCFFPRHNVFSPNRYHMAEELTTGDRYSYDFESASGDGYQYPVPDRGYSVSGLVIRRKPVLNAAGIAVGPSTLGTTEALDVIVGIMAGTGVIAGAVSGVFPGQFLAFETIPIPANEDEVHINKFWPVLEGCCLAYSCLERVVITAYVDFQPAVNVRSFSATIVQSRGPGSPANITYPTVQWCGQPYFQRHFGWAHNFNSDNAGGNLSLAAVCMPTLSARAMKDLTQLLTVTP